MTTNGAVPRAWPWWLAFGVLIPLATLALIVAIVLNLKTISLADDDDLVGHNAVVSAKVTFEPVANVPWGYAVYTLTLPNSAPGALAGSTHNYQTPTHFLITDKELFPSPADFRIVYTQNGGYNVIGPEPAGSLQVITPATVAQHTPAVNRAKAALSGAILGYLVLFTGLLVPSIVQSARRSRALAPARAARMAQAIAASNAAMVSYQWRPDPSWLPPSQPPPGPSRN